MTQTEKFFSTIGTILFAFTLFIGYTSHAYAEELVATGTNGASVTIYDTPCVSEKVGKAHPDKDLSMGSKAETLMSNGKRIEACWVFVAPDIVYVIDEMGDEGPLPVQMFKKADHI
jgi:hypothetical protein